MSYDSQLSLFATFLTVRIIWSYLLKCIAVRKIPFFQPIPNSAKRSHSSWQHFLANKIVEFEIIEKNAHF